MGSLTLLVKPSSPLASCIDLSRTGRRSVSFMRPGLREGFVPGGLLSLLLPAAQAIIDNGSARMVR